jgi:molybdate transport system substrate-binding protein
MNRLLVVIASAALMCAGVRPTAAAELRVFAPRAIGTVSSDFASKFQALTKPGLDVVVDLTPSLVRRFRAGDHADVVVALPDLIDKLAEDGLLLPQTRTKLIKSGLGLQVRSGQPKPDISSLDSFKRVVLAANSIGYLKTPTGVQLDEEFSRLGILDQIASKAIRPETDIVSNLVAEGKVEMGIVVSTQILTTPGVTFVGPLPPELQYFVTFSGGVSADTNNAAAGRELLTFLHSPEAKKVIRAQGMQPDSDWVDLSKHKVR